MTTSFRAWVSTAPASASRSTRVRATSERRSRNGGPGTAIGLSEGALVLNAVQARLANDPTAPPPDKLSFAMYGDPVARHPFGESFLTQMFPVGSVVPSLDYRVPAPVESQYDTYHFVSAYDSIADWPDRPDNWMSLANAVVGPRDRSHRGGVHQAEYGAAAEHQDDRQLQGREDDDLSDSRKTPSTGAALRLSRGAGVNAESA